MVVVTEIILLGQQKWLLEAEGAWVHTTSPGEQGHLGEWEELLSEPRRMWHAKDVRKIRTRPPYRDACKKGQNHSLAISDLDHCPKSFMRQPSCNFLLFSVCEPVMSACCQSLRILDSIRIHPSGHFCKPSKVWIPSLGANIVYLQVFCPLHRGKIENFQSLILHFLEQSSAFFHLYSNLQSFPLLSCLMLGFPGVNSN